MQSYIELYPKEAFMSKNKNSNGENNSCSFVIKAWIVFALAAAVLYALLWLI
jgi:hypothetical protein